MVTDFPHVRLTESVAVAPQLTPEGMVAVAAAGYRVVINNRPDGEVPEQLSSDVMRAAAEAAGLRYVYYPLDAFNYPGDDISPIRELFDNGADPVLAFCRSGTRSTNLWISTREGEGRAAAMERAQQLGFDVSMALRA
jgi:uncharacterized protein (TIGR01244 family)